MVSGYSKYTKEALQKVSSKSLPGILEGPDGTGVGVGGSSIPMGTFPEGLMMIPALDLRFRLDFELCVVVVVACMGISRLSHGLTITKQKL